MKSTLRVLLAMIFCILNVSCRGGTDMSCESELHKTLSSMYENGATKRQILESLNRSNVEMMDVPADDFKKYGEPPAESLDLFGIILVSVNAGPADATNTELGIKKTELIRVGYDKDGGLISYACKDVYTGP